MPMFRITRRLIRPCRTRSGALPLALLLSAAASMTTAPRADAVPDAPAAARPGIEKVETIRAGRAVETTVTTGRRGPAWVEIVEGLAAGTPVVLEPAGLRSGQPVIVNGLDPTPRAAQVPTNGSP